MRLYLKKKLTTTTKPKPKYNITTAHVCLNCTVKSVNYLMRAAEWYTPGFSVATDLAIHFLVLL